MSTKTIVARKSSGSFRIASAIFAFRSEVNACPSGSRFSAGIVSQSPTVPFSPMYPSSVEIHFLFLR